MRLRDWIELNSANGVTYSKMAKLLGMTNITLKKKCLFESFVTIEEAAKVKMLTGGEVDFDDWVSEKVWNDCIRLDDSSPFGMREKILETLIKNTGLKMQDIVKKTTNQDIINARRAGYVLCYRRRMTFQRIGNIFQRTHSAILEEFAIMKEQRAEKPFEEKEEVEAIVRVCEIHLKGLQWNSKCDVFNTWRDEFFEKEGIDE